MGWRLEEISRRAAFSEDLRPEHRRPDFRQAAVNVKKC